MSVAAAFDAHDAIGLAALVRAKQVTPTELLDEALRRVDSVNPQLNAVVTSMSDVARRNIALGLPDGPFTGVPFLLKDLAAQYAGVRMQGGSTLYKDHVPTEHSEIVKRYERAGLVVFGKTNTSEWGIFATCETRAYGACHNPWKLGYTTGGSSGGSAAAVAARIAPAAHGGDAGGSIRIPASCCGVFGLKPTRARNPFGPDTSERAHGLGVEHVLSVSVRDSAALLDATAGPEHVAIYWAPPKERPFLEEATRDPKKLRIAFTSKPILPADEDAEQRRAVDDAVKLLVRLGHDVEEARPPIDSEGTGRHFFTLYCASVGGELELQARLRGRELTLDDVEVPTLIMGLIGRNVLSAGQFSEAIRELQGVARAMARFHGTYDLLLTPTLGKAPVQHGALLAKGIEATLQAQIAKHSLATVLKVPGVLDKAVRRAFNFACYTQIANVTGQPSMSVPLFFSESGLPIGVCFTAPFGDEATLFQLAGQLERARPWKDRRPPVCARA